MTSSLSSGTGSNGEPETTERLAGKPSKEPKPKPRWSKPLEWWLTRTLVRSLNLIGGVTPRSALTPIGKVLGRLTYRTMTRYRKVALSNLERAYGDVMDAESRRKLAVESFEHIGITLIEFFLRQPRITMDEIEREVRFEGQEHYEEAFSHGKGVLLITGHYGNWEMMGPRLARAGFQVHAVSRTADDPGMENMIESIRTRCGLKQIPRRQAARQGLAALRKNEILAILLDQNTAEGGVFVPFYGYPASTATGPAVFALKTGAAIVPTFCLREADGSHTMKAWPPLYPQSTGDRNADIRHLTAEITRIIELQIRERPELWCWLHNRWKLQPNDGAQGETAERTASSGSRKKGLTECSKPSE